MNDSRTNDTHVDTQAETRADQHVCLNMNARLRTKVWFEVNGQFAIGEGGIDLLAAIMSTGSITRAARNIGWSYRHAWGYIRNAEKILATSLIQAKPGKGSGRGTTLTAAGRMLFAHLTAARDRIEKAAQAVACCPPQPTIARIAVP